jgi:hypothetical protein
LKITVIVLASILALVLLVWGGLWVARAIVYRDYLAEKETVCKIPALGDGFVPQGLSTAEDGVYLHSLYYLDSTNYDKTVKLPAFSEGLAIEGDRVLINFELACNKYIVGKLFFANKIVSYPIG